MQKKIIYIIVIIMGCYFMYENNLLNFQGIVRDFKKEVVTPNTTKYKKNVEVSYVKQTNDFSPDNYQDILNIYYTVLNSGWDEFVFYCPDTYKNCIDDVKTISEDKDNLLSHLNSFVNSYNTYNNIYTTYYKTGKVKLEIVHLYEDFQIEKIDTKINEIIKKVIDTNASTQDKLKAFHDYIINNTKYDTKKVDNPSDDTYHSNTAYGLLFENYAVCSGYADTYELFLDKMNIPNIKVATNKHVWNLAYIDNKWYHIDLTWDDPITSTGEQILSDSFFMITGDRIKSYNTGEHNFDTSIYPEAK